MIMPILIAGIDVDNRILEATNRQLSLALDENNIICFQSYSVKIWSNIFLNNNKKSMTSYIVDDVIA